MRIAIAGKKCSGKSTLADYLSNELGYKRMAFADKLKEQTSLLIRFLISKGWVPPHGYDFTIKDRAMLQFVGTDLFRTVDDEIWVKHLMNAVQGDDIVVDDLRFDNELAACKSNNFITIMVECEEGVRQDREKRLYGKVEGNDHISENGITIACDYIINGTQSKEDMIDELKAIVACNIAFPS
jgi:hypothetical protein